MKKFLLTIITIFFAYYCAFLTSGTDKKKGLFGSSNSPLLYKFICKITGETDTTDAKSVFNRGDKYLNDKEFELALQDMNKVLSLDSSYFDARMVMANAYLGLKDTISAINNLLICINKSHNTSVVFYELGNIFKDKGLSDSSFYYYRKSFNEDNAFAKAGYEVAQYYFKNNKLDEALECINLCVSQEEYNLEFRNFRRIIYIKQNRQDLADQEYQFIQSTNSEYFGNYKEKADQEKNNNNWQAAVEYYKLALQEQIDNREILESRAWVYHSLQKYDSALIDFYRVLELNPDYLSYFNVAYTLDILGKVKESVENYSKSIELKNDYYISYNSRGYEYYRLKDFKRAEADYTKSIELKSDYYLSLYNRGILYYDTKKYAKAVEDYQNAIKYADDAKDLYYSIALAYDKLKKKKETITSFNEFLKLTNENDSIRTNYATERIADLSK